LPWDTIPDNGRYSLALMDAATDNANAANWSAQVVRVTPKAENAFCNGSLAYNPMIVDVSCNGATDGFITGNATGGTSPYAYSWSNGVTVSNISNLSAGTYNLDLTDANGCAFSQSYTITEPAALSATVSSTNESYFQASDGTATVNVTGGSPSYTYNWPNGATTSLINSLAPGSYSVNIADSNGCQLTKTVIIQAIDCSSLAASISKTDQSYYQTNNGTASVNVTGGAASYTYTWSNGATTSSLTGLAPGTYVVDILDAVGCTLSQSILINSLVCNTIVTDVTVHNESCFGKADGLLEITSIQNGTSPYSILWSTGITGMVTNNLTGGTYQLQITDTQGCPFNESYTINSATALSANTLITNASSNNSNNGAIDLTVTGGASPYSYNWSTAAATEDVSGLMPGSYSVSVSDANNCQLSLNNLQVDNDCPVSLIQQNYPALSTEVFQVEQFIQSNGMIDINKQVGFKAGNYIELTNEFEVMQGAEFEAKIEACQ